MSILGDYRIKVGLDGSTPIERTVNTRVREYNSSFQRAPEYEQVRVTNDSSNTTNYDSWIYSNSSYKQLVSMKTIIFAPGTPDDIVFSGQYIRPQRQGGLFMLYSDDKQYENKLKGLMDECTETLRRYNDDGVLVEIPIILRSRSSGSLDEDKYMVLTDGSHQVGLPKTAETLKWEEGTTFILANRHKYRIAWIDDVKSSTYMEFRLQKYEENSSVDNMKLGIADYANRARFRFITSLNNTQMEVGDSFKAEVQLQASGVLTRDTTTWNAIVNGLETKVESWNTIKMMPEDWTRLVPVDLGVDTWYDIFAKPVKWSSSDTNVATVDAVGNITAKVLGDVNIRVEMVNNSNVFLDIPIQVVDTKSDNITYSVSPDIGNFLRQQEEVINVTKLNNGETETETFTFTVDGSSTVNASDYEFEVIDSDSYRIKNLGTVGNLVINIVPNSDVGNAFNVTYELSNSFW